MKEKKRGRPGKTLHEFHQERRQTGEYERFVAMRAKADAEQMAEEARLRAAESPLLSELEATGLRIRSIWDLVNRRNDYAHALPILVRHVEKDYPSRVREGIARALAVPEARFALDTILRLYRAEDARTAPDAKEGLAVALSVVASHGDADAIVELALNTAHGSSRVHLVGFLASCESQRAAQALQQLLLDDAVRPEVQRVLKRRATRRR